LIDTCLKAEGIEDAGDLRAAATAFDGLLVVRWLGEQAHVVRRAYACFWSAFRAHAAGLPARLPRLWHV
jgi:urease accessory protein